MKAPEGTSFKSVVTGSTVGRHMYSHVLRHVHGTDLSESDSYFVLLLIGFRPIHAWDTEELESCVHNIPILFMFFIFLTYSVDHVFSGHLTVRVSVADTSLSECV